MQRYQPYHTLSVHTVYCVAVNIAERAVAFEYTEDSVRVTETKRRAFLSVCDKEKVFLIPLNEEQINTFREGDTYIIKNARVKQEQPFWKLFMGNGIQVFKTAPLTPEQSLIHLGKESVFPTSVKTPLTDPRLFLKEGYITISGKIVSVSIMILPGLTFCLCSPWSTHFLLLQQKGKNQKS